MARKPRNRGQTTVYLNKFGHRRNKTRSVPLFHLLVPTAVSTRRNNQMARVNVSIPSGKIARQQAGSYANRFFEDLLKP